MAHSDHGASREQYQKDLECLEKKSCHYHNVLLLLLLLLVQQPNLVP
jgi:hypothetical protein